MFLNEDFPVLQILNKEECNQIIDSIEENTHKLRVSEENGDIYLSVYEMQLSDLDEEVTTMVLKKLDGIVDYRLALGQFMILKYSEDLINEMPGHYDGSFRTLIINLNNDFEGGETKFHFHRYEHKPQEHPVGSGVLFRANSLKSWHKSKPVTKGVRYALVFKWIETFNGEGRKLKLSEYIKLIRYVLHYKCINFLYKIFKRIKWLR